MTLWWYLPHVMTECNQLASYIVRRHAGFDANQARRHIRKPRHNPAATIVIAYRRDRQLVLVLPKQFVAKRDEFVIGQLAPERSCLCSARLLSPFVSAMAVSSRTRSTTATCCA